MAQNKQKQNQKPLVMRILATALFMAVLSPFVYAQRLANTTETDKNSGNNPHTMIFNPFQVKKANDSSSKGMFQRSEKNGKNTEGLRDTKTDIMFAKGFADYTTNSYSAVGTDRTAVANSTNATSVTYAMQVFNGSTGAIRGNQNTARNNYSCRNTTTYNGYYISSVSLTVSGGTIDGSTSGRSVVYFGSSAYANPNNTAPTGTATAASPASSGQTTLTWTNSNENVSYFILYNLKTGNTALSANATTSLKVVWTQKANATPSITVSDADITYDATSGSIPVTIANPVTGGTLSAISSESWLTIGTVTTTSVPFTCTANTNNSSRSATITLTYTYTSKASVTQTVTVTQAGNTNCDYPEDFESVSGASTGYNAAGTLPTGWHRIYNNTVYDATVTTTPYEMPHVHHGSSYPGLGSGTNALSGNYLGFYGTGNGSICYAIMPAIPANEAANHISFKFRYESTSYGTLSYGVIDGTDASTYDQIGICPKSNNNGLVDVDLDITETTGKRIAFCWEYNGASWYTAGIDDICVRTETVSNCPTPTALNVTNVTPTSATLNWTGEGESYNVRYRATSDGFSYDFESATPWAVDDFSPCTTYDGDGYYTGAIENVTFENQHYTGSFIAFQNGVTGNAAAHNGNAFGACFYASTPPNDDYFILPAITIQSGYVFKFWAKSFSSSYLESFRAGVYNGNGNLTAVLGSNANVSNTWTEYSYNLSSYVGQTIQLAIHCNSNDRFAFFIDDIFVGDPNFTPTWSEPITGVTSPYILTGLDSETEYEFQVQADCGSEGESGWSASATFTTPDACTVPTDLNATNITASTATLSWTGFTDTYNIQYREYDPTAPATIILNVPSDIWGDGSGYQMVLDADATMYAQSSISSYDEFEYTIPTNAVFDINTNTIVINNSVSIQIPAGTYDYFILNPSPDYDNIYVAGSNGNVGGKGDDFVFEAGKTYEFTLFLLSGEEGDGVNLTITNNGSAWIPLNGITNPYPLQNLNPQTTYQYQVQGVNCDGNGHNTDWSAYAYFTTLNGYSVTYNSNGGTGTTTDPNIYGTGSLVTVLPNSFTGPNYQTFNGWNTAANGSGTSYLPGATFTIISNTILYAQWIDTWATEVHSKPSTYTNGATVELHNANDLAWAISVVNGLNGQTAAPSTNFNVTADINMDHNVWIPMGTETAPYTGTFNANGHHIEGLHSLLNTENMGMFGSLNGTVENMILYASFTQGNPVNMGTVAATMSGGTISNVETGGALIGTANTETMGGIVGNKTGGTIHSSFAVNTITSANATTHVGGLVGNNIGNLYNSYANTTISGSGQIGGLAGKNNGTIENCYAVVGSQSFPAFAYENAEGGTIQYCYADNANGYVNTTAGGTPTPVLRGHGTYGTVKDRKAIGYMYDDNAVTLVAGNNSYVSSALAYNAASTQIEKWPGMLSALNQWVKSHSGYTPWFRPTSSNINGDLPVLGFTSDNCLGTIDADGKYLAYGSIANGANGLDDLLFVFNNNVGDAASSLFLYGSATAVTRVPESQVKTFVNEDAALIQANGAGDFTNVTVGITFDNSYKTGASDYFGTPLEYDWHFLSSPLQAAPMGMTYGAGTGYGNHASVNGMTGNYLPNGLVGQSTVKWDIYSFFEPQYHWINLKRATGDHWHFEEPHDLIDAYTNESTFLQGKGYMMAISQDSYLSSTGTLNNGNNDITVKLTMQSPQTEELGCNLLGNPYQAYLDMNQFLKSGTDNNTYMGSSYWVYVAEGDNYIAGNCSASTNYAIPSQTLHPHQAFFVKTDTDNVNATFNYGMITDKPIGVSYYRGRTDYPLVNLFAYNDEGRKDLAVIEVNRPLTDGSQKLRAMNNANFELYTRLNSQDYSILFTEEGTERVTLCFKAKDDGTFTLRWDTQNGSFDYLRLIDNITGQECDMLSSDHYRFSANATDMATRFYVVFHASDGDEPVNTDTFAFFNGNAWVVQGQGQLELVDVMGHKLYSTYLSGDTSEVHFGNLAAGTYMICLVMKDNKVKTQKIVIKN